MKSDYPYLSKERLCGLFGKTRHAFYDHLWRQDASTIKEEIVLQLVQKIRTDLPRLGTRKLLYLLAPELSSHQISIGRDALFDLLSEHKLLVRYRKRKVITTDSRHWMRKYSNLVTRVAIGKPEQVWVSDITYIRMNNQWGYLSMVTDAYSRKIMGYAFRSDMLAEGCVDALQMALQNRQYKDHQLIHHSDRGSQYCCKEYIALLNKHDIAVSMTENGDPYENALAERINGIIKNEFNLHVSNLGLDDTRTLIDKSISAYNTLRPHSSCNYLTPSQAHQQEAVLTKKWKKYNRQNRMPDKTVLAGPGGGSNKKQAPWPGKIIEHQNH